MSRLTDSRQWLPERKTTRNPCIAPDVPGHSMDTGFPVKARQRCPLNMTGHILLKGSA
jgi:hypothetical protein